MLNRMMFIYFIQKQGFLNRDTNYLHTKLLEVQEKQGRGRFQQFYYIFLRRLFHEGARPARVPANARTRRAAR